jgi:hypothetical protein
MALYSLQDGLAASGVSFPVECGRCLLAFQATAPRREITTPLQTARVVARAPTPAAAVERSVPPEELARALKPRRPEVPARVDAIRPGPRRVLIGAGVAVAAAILALVATQVRFSGLPKEAAARMETARQKLLRDDLQSLEEAGALFSEAARIAPGAAAPEAERAFALLLQAATHKDLADRLGGAARELNDRVARLQTEKQPGFEGQVAQISQQISQLATERDLRARDATKLLQQGVAAAKAALEDDPEDAAALRSMALWSALGDAPDRGARYLDQAEKKTPHDPYIAWTRAALALTGAATREKQDRALAALAQARQSEPRLLRAQVDAAAISMDRQEAGPAREALKKALEQNPQHERAKRLLALLPTAP